MIYGPERTERLNPARSALDRGISTTIHHDSPVHPVDQLFLVWAAVNRVTRSGAVIGPDQRITPQEALEASTIEAAHQLFEEQRKGSLSPGKLADLVILEANPLEVAPLSIKDIGVAETLEGRPPGPSPALKRKGPPRERDAPRCIPCGTRLPPLRAPRRRPATRSSRAGAAPSRCRA